MMVLLPQMRADRMRRRVLTSARLIQESIPRGWRAIMITTTYRPGAEWESGDIRRMVRCARGFLARRRLPLRYVWTLEYQKRGAPHYHLVLWLPWWMKLPMPDKQGWWTKGSTRIEREVRNVVGYVAKISSGAAHRYISKAHLPNDSHLIRGARMYGAGGLGAANRSIVRWWLLPRWVREWSKECGLEFNGAAFGRCAGGGWVCRLTGEIRDGEFDFILPDRPPWPDAPRPRYGHLRRKA